MTASSPSPSAASRAASRLDQRRRRLDERAPQHQIFGRVAGEHHLGEGDEMRAALGRVLRPGDDVVCVAVEVADDRVDLGEGEAQLRHVDQLKPRLASVGAA